MKVSNRTEFSLLELERLHTYHVFHTESSLAEVLLPQSLLEAGSDYVIFVGSSSSSVASDYVFTKAFAPEDGLVRDVQIASYQKSLRVTWKMPSFSLGFLGYYIKLFVWETSNGDNFSDLVWNISDAIVVQDTFVTSLESATVFGCSATSACLHTNTVYGLQITSVFEDHEARAPTHLAVTLRASIPQENKAYLSLARGQIEIIGQIGLTATFSEPSTDPISTLDQTPLKSARLSFDSEQGFIDLMLSNATWVEELTLTKCILTLTEEDFSILIALMHAHPLSALSMSLGNGIQVTVAHSCLFSDDVRRMAHMYRPQRCDLQGRLWKHLCRQRGSLGFLSATVHYTRFFRYINGFSSKFHSF
jgi:hypothetical protein